MSGEVLFRGDAMAAVVQGVIEVERLVGSRPVIVGGLAVLARLTHPYRATVDLDVVDRLTGPTPHLQILRAVEGVSSQEPAAVLLPTAYGEVKVDVLEVRQIELDEPSEDPGDRLHAFSHAWASDTATDLTMVVLRHDGSRVEATTPVAEPGPLVAMKLQAVMNRSESKQGTDLLDIIRITFDQTIGRRALLQIGDVADAVASDIGLHVNLWFERRRRETLRLVHTVGGSEFSLDDIDLVAELLADAARR